MNTPVSGFAGGHSPLFTLGWHDSGWRCAVTGASQRPSLDYLVGDQVHRSDPPAHSIDELLVIARLDCVDSGGDCGTERICWARMHHPCVDAEVDFIVSDERITAARQLPFRQPDSRHVHTLPSHVPTPFDRGVGTQVPRTATDIWILFGDLDVARPITPSV